ncbi:hypothetical protein ABZ690_36215 [Streptomyces sp. NPDC006967]|uniref:hypothetical protein n=1 Tax=unclassified Streptomyces TaxID=2593676 RepID=UPI000CD5C237|nr:hypothetical protein [Streptomyces sp. SM1]
MNETSWLGEEPEPSDEEEALFEVLREDIGQPPATALEQAITAAQLSLQLPYPGPDKVTE